MIDTNVETSDWEQAITHLHRIRGIYEEAEGTDGLHVAHILNKVIAPLAIRYYEGERTPELHEAMLKLS